MKFSVTFTSPKKTEIVQHMGAAGIDMLDILRGKFPILKKIPLDKIVIDIKCPITYNQYHLILTEEQARETGLFSGKSNIQVNVPEFFFSQFIDWSYEEIRKKVSGFKSKFFKGEFKYVNLEQVLDQQTLFNTWKAAKFTQFWGVETPSDEKILSTVS